MGVRRKPRRTREAEVSFEAISVEGGLLSPEWLSKIAQLGAGLQTEADYRIPKGLNLRDEIGRYWRIAQAYWTEVQTARKAGADSDAIARRFVTALLREALGFSSLAPATPVVIDGRVYPIGLAALGGRVPIVVAPFDAENGVDTLSSAFGDGGRRRSAFGLAQEYLNAQDGALWGIACDGKQLRIVRDNASLTRPAWIAADLERIFSEERYADFTALWLLAHETRFGRETEPVAACSLEAWRSAGLEEGTRAREHLRRGVEEALLALGQGFLAHAENHALRSALEEGMLSTKAYQNELLRLVYRIIFLLTVEERGVLHARSESDASRDLYERAYSFRHLRERSLKRSAHDRSFDLWEAAKIVFRGLAVGEPRLALPALAGIFSRSRCAHLDSSRLENRWLLLAVFKLAWLKDAGSVARVNWRDMGPEELGSVYESLLELTPQVTRDGRQFVFATGNETKGNARKTTGSYYTPDSLVQLLLDSALEPVIAETIATNPTSPIEALLELSIVDAACGSGHFLLAAARRLATHVARLRVNGTPSMAEYRHALRQVVGRCIYGVDLNPLAVELCKVGLWMEAVDPGLPLTFLDSHIQRGNALFGATPDLMANGIPDAAWEATEGDDKKTASALKKRNKDETRGQASFDFATPQISQQEAEVVTRAVWSLDAASDATLDALTTKEVTWESILGSAEYRHQRFVADAWCAAFVWPKQPGDLAEAARTTDLWRRIRDGQAQPPALTSQTVNELAEQHGFFHWHLQFPQVFAKGGFEVVLGNPPWERVKLQEQEFFAKHNQEIVSAPNAAARKRLIAKLSDEDPQLWSEWQIAGRRAEGESHFIRQSGLYPMCGKGDVNTYAVFAEKNWTLLGRRGRAGFIVPSGIATDDTTKEFFVAVSEAGRLQSLYDFRNHDGLFYDIGHRRFKFCLITVLGQSVAVDRAALVFFAESASDTRNPERTFGLSASEFATLNPNTHTCPTFRSRRDADINLAIYAANGILWRDANGNRGNPWGLKFLRMLDMANDSADFRTRHQLELNAHLEGNHFVGPTEIHLPLYEAKMLHHFNHRFGDYGDKPKGSLDSQLPDIPVARLDDPSYQPLPRYWVNAREIESRLARSSSRRWLLGWRDICRSTDERTVIASLIPRVGVGHTTPLIFSDLDPRVIACLYACLCSFTLDYTARQKIGGTHLTYSYIKQLPVLPPSAYSVEAAWDRRTLVKDWILSRVLELTYTAWDLEPFAVDVGYRGAPFHWEIERRFLLRCELDAAFFHLYGLSRADTDYVMDCFPIVRKNDEKNHGEFRTKRVILDIYDAMAAAMRAGTPYQTRLDPPAAAPPVAHSAGTMEPAPAESKPRRAKAAIQPQALPDIAALRDNEWSRPHTFERGEVQAAIVAVLKQFREPVSPHQVRVAALYCLEPQLLVPSIESAERSSWTRVVGADAQREQSSSLDQISAEWGKALAALRGRGVLMETSQPEMWALGTSESDIDTSGWADGRAAFVVSVLVRESIPATDTQSAERLPALVREWLAHAA